MSVEEDILARILKLIENHKPIEFDNIFDLSGGNYDDAYNIGFNNGEAYLAEQIRGVINNG